MPDQPVPTTTQPLAVTPASDTNPDATVTHDGAASPPANSFAFLGPARVPGHLGRLGGYEVVRLLGQGGMGFVFLAEDDQLRRRVALKVMRPEVAARPEARERFLREGRAAAAVRSDHVATIHQVGEDNRTAFLVIEYLEGSSLSEWHKANPGPAPTELVARVARDVLQGLSAAHARGLVHRDIKPHNLWLEAGTGRVKILDFGLTRFAEEPTITGEGQIVGTPAYMAPEQASGKTVDARTDLFSLGIVLYTLASGENPFHRASVLETLGAVISCNVPSAKQLPGISEELARLIDRLLKREPGDRPSSAQAALSGWQAVPITAHSKPRRARGAWLGLAGVATILIVALLVWRPFQTAPAPVEGDPRSAPTTAAVEALRITDFDIKHLAVLDGRSVERGLFGRDSFTARQNDLARLEVRFTRPAFSYLLAFRPDGEVDLCHPAAETEEPTVRDRLTYPHAGIGRGKAYGLSEAPGLWVFAVLASDEPLPPFAEWRNNHPLPKLKGAPGLPGTVLIDDGIEIEHWQPLGLRRGGRGLGEDVPGLKALELVFDTLRRSAPGATIKSVGITVLPRAIALKSAGS